MKVDDNPPHNILTLWSKVKVTETLFFYAELHYVIIHLYTIYEVTWPQNKKSFDKGEVKCTEINYMTLSSQVKVILTSFFVYITLSS